jgi:hypothetical protein
MKQAKKLKVFGLMTMLISMVFMVSSCSDDDTGGGALSYGKVTGVVITFPCSLHNISVSTSHPVRTSSASIGAEMIRTFSLL